MADAGPLALTVPHSRPFPLEAKRRHGQSPPLLTLPRHRATLLPLPVPPACLSTSGLLLDPGRVLAFFLPSNSFFPHFPLETSLFFKTHCRYPFPPGVPYFTLHTEGVPSGTVSSWLGRALESDPTEGCYRHRRPPCPTPASTCSVCTSLRTSCSSGTRCRPATTMTLWRTCRGRNVEIRA